MAWLMKDFAWVLLIPVLAWPMALVAPCLECHNVLLGWRLDSAAVRVHGLASLLWILGNVTWMSSELLWDSSSCYQKGDKRSIFPWHAGPSAGANEDLYWKGVMNARILFALALFLLASFYFVAACGIMRSRFTNQQVERASSESQSLVWGIVTPKVYVMVFIGPWILKDVCWTFSLFAPALTCSALVFALAMDSYRRFRALPSAVEMTWVAGNTVWLITELGYQTPALLPRVFAACFLLLGVALAKQAYDKTSPDLAASESSALIGDRSS